MLIFIKTGSQGGFSFQSRMRCEVSSLLFNSRNKRTVEMQTKQRLWVKVTHGMWMGERESMMKSVEWLGCKGDDPFSFKLLNLLAQINFISSVVAVMFLQQPLVEGLQMARFLAQSVNRPVLMIQVCNYRLPFIAPKLGELWMQWRCEDPQPSVSSIISHWYQLNLRTFSMNFWKGSSSCPDCAVTAGCSWSQWKAKYTYEVLFTLWCKMCQGVIGRKVGMEVGDRICIHTHVWLPHDCWPPSSRF